MCLPTHRSKSARINFIARKCLPVRNYIRWGENFPVLFFHQIQLTLKSLANPSKEQTPWAWLSSGLLWWLFKSWCKHLTPFICGLAITYLHYFTQRYMLFVIQYLQLYCKLPNSNMYSLFLTPSRLWKKNNWSSHGPDTNMIILFITQDCITLI